MDNWLESKIPKHRRATEDQLNKVKQAEGNPSDEDKEEWGGRYEKILTDNQFFILTGLWIAIFSIGSFTTFHLWYWLIESLPLDRQPMNWKIFNGVWSPFLGRVLALVVSVWGGRAFYDCCGFNLGLVRSPFWRIKPDK